jgi:hypothetical protein
VQERDEADLGAEVFRISGDRSQGLGAGAKQDVVRRFLVLIGDVRDPLGNGKDHMEILDCWEQFGLAVFEPLRTGKRLALGTMPISARVEGDALMSAGVTLFDMATECSGAAQFDRTHHARWTRLSEPACVCRYCGPQLQKAWAVTLIPHPFIDLSVHQCLNTHFLDASRYPNV